MRTRLTSLVLLAAALPGIALGQGAEKPLTQAEILGRLAAGYSPSYVARLVKARGIGFSINENLLSAVRSAGGEGVLVEQLSTVDASGAPHSFFEAEGSTVDLAKCAESVRDGALGPAEKECLAATEANPESPWTWLATLHIFDKRGVSPRERIALLDRCAAAAPEFVPMHSTPTTELSTTMRREAVTKALLEAADSSDDAQGYLYSSESEAEFRDQPELESPSPVIEEQIRSEIEKLFHTSSELARGHVIAAHYYQTLGEVAREQGELEEALQLEPGNAGIHYALGHFFRAQHQTEAELTEFQKAAQLVPYGLPEHQAIGESLGREGRTEEAISVWREFLGLAPENLPASNALVQLYLQKKDRGAAIAELRRSLKVSSESSRDEATYSNERFQDIDYLAQLLGESHEFIAAGDLYESQLRFHPESISLHNSYGNVLFAARRFAEAAAEYRVALQGAPELSLVHRNLGICFAAEKKLDDAISEFRRAQETDPEDRSVRIVLGDALVQKGELNGAMEQYREVLASDPEDAVALTHLAHTFFENNDAASAVAELAHALELKPDFPEAENELARIYATSSDPQYHKPLLALAAARKAVQGSQDPVPGFLDTLAEALLQNGQPGDALKAEEQAAVLDQEDPARQNRLVRFRQAALSASAMNR